MIKHLRSSLLAILLVCCCAFATRPTGLSFKNLNKVNTATTSEPDFGLVGYATLAGGTTGGQGGREITVTTGAELQAALNAKKKETQPLIIYVNGKITPENSPGLSKIDVKELKDVTILGVGTKGEFDGIGIKIYKASNVIVRNVTVHHVRIGDKDCISIEGPSDHIWIDHCELYNTYQGVSKDYYDALLDAKAESEYITFSWNYLHDSWKAGLSGSSESDTYDRKITYHHNYFENINSRLPLYRGGQGHVFNNYYKDIVETAVNSRLNACLKIENNYFLNTNNPYVTAYSNVEGYGDISGNILVNSPFKYTSDEKELKPCSLQIPYTYAHALHDAADVPGIVAQYAGVGKIDVTGGVQKPAPATYQLTTNVTGQGTVTPAGGTFEAGITVTLTATPAAGWKFAGWSGAASGTANPVTVTMIKNKSVTATFAEENAGGDPGTTTPTPSGPTVRIGTNAGPATGLCSYDGSLRTVEGESVPVVNLTNAAAKGITWKIEAPAAGNYALTWRYAGGGSSAAETAKLLINGNTALASIAFPKPKDSKSFLVTEPVTVQLEDGVNEIRIETTVASAFADIQWIEVTGDSPQATDCENAVGYKSTVASARKDAALAGLLKAYPNPVKDAVIFEINLAKRDNIKVSLYNSAGVKVAEVVNQQFNAGTTQLSYKVNHLKGGLYFYVVETERGILREKLIIQ